MGERAFRETADGAASRPHAYTRRHNLVSDEVKPGYAGHVPVARDTVGTSFYRDAFTHRTGTSLHRELEDGALEERPTSGQRFFSLSAAAKRRPSTPTGGTPRQPGLRDHERITGRPTSARLKHPNGRYFTMSSTPRRAREVAL